MINLWVGSTSHIERYAGHIGYGVHEEFRGRRYAARSVMLLLPLARRLGLDPLWITCDPENLASRRSLELAGAEFIEIVDVPEDCGMRKYGGKDAEVQVPALIPGVKRASICVSASRSGGRGCL